jgi:hypothetical protein
MIYHGRNLMLSVDGVVIAGAKSCTLDVDISTVKVSSPTDADWEHIKSRIKKWSVSTEHLLKSNAVPAHMVRAFGSSNNGSSSIGPASWVEVDGTMYDGGTRGFQLRTFEWNPDTGRFGVKVRHSFDTYGSSEAISNMIDDLNNYIDTGDIVVITSYDACAMTTELAAAIETALGIDAGTIPTFTATRASFVAVGVYQSNGIVFCNEDAGSTVRATLFLDGARNIITGSPMKNGVDMVGKTCKLRMNMEGFAEDTLTGEAIITSFKTSGTVGSLMSGKFTFKGSGPLE